jgi:hypothetical protein
VSWCSTSLGSRAPFFGSSSNINGVILVAGFTINLEAAFYNKETIDGHKKGLSDEQIQTIIKN